MANICSLGVDFCLLRLRSQQTNDSRSVYIRTILKTVTGETRNEPYNELLAERLRDGGFADETDWLVSCVRSDSAELSLKALAAGDNDPQISEAASNVLLNRDLRGDVRAAAIQAIANASSSTVLFTLCDVLDDPATACKPEFTPMLRKDYPFANRVLVQSMYPLVERHMKASPNASQTIGTLARTALKARAKKDYGTDPAVAKMGGILVGGTLRMHVVSASSAPENPRKSPVPA